jgi:hypothetical protein
VFPAYRQTTVLPKGDTARLSWEISVKSRCSIGEDGLPSPSRHIYKSLTIAVAFRRFTAFEGILQHPIKVDGTSA